MSKKVYVKCPVFDDWKKPTIEDKIFICSLDHEGGSGCPLQNECDVGHIKAELITDLSIEIGICET